MDGNQILDLECYEDEPVVGRGTRFSGFPRQVSRMSQPRRDTEMSECINQSRRAYNSRSLMTTVQPSAPSPGNRAAQWLTAESAARQKAPLLVSLLAPNIRPTGNEMPQRRRTVSTVSPRPQSSIEPPIGAKLPQTSPKPMRPLIWVPVPPRSEIPIEPIPALPTSPFPLRKSTSLPIQMREPVLSRNGYLPDQRGIPQEEIYAESIRRMKFYEEQTYRQKLLQLTKYFQPLQLALNHMSDGDKQRFVKTNNLLQILVNPHIPTSLSTLFKCEEVLKKHFSTLDERTHAPEVVNANMQNLELDLETRSLWYYRRPIVTRSLENPPRRQSQDTSTEIPSSTQAAGLAHDETSMMD